MTHVAIVVAKKITVVPRIRSRAGLYYETQAEFVETLKAIADGRTLNAALGANGRTFFDRHYAWPVIERKYLDMLQRLSNENVRADVRSVRLQADLKEPGFFAKRRRMLPPANDVLAGLPSGAAIEYHQHAAVS